MGYASWTIAIGEHMRLAAEAMEKKARSSLQTL